MVTVEPVFAMFEVSGVGTNCSLESSLVVTKEHSSSFTVTDQVSDHAVLEQTICVHSLQTYTHTNLYTYPSGHVVKREWLQSLGQKCS